MSKTAKRSFKATDNYRNIRVNSLNNIRINYNCSIGSFTGNSAGCICIVMPKPFSSGVMSNHRINIAARNQKTEPRSAKLSKIAVIFPIRLAQHGYPVALIFKKSCEYSHTEGWVVNIAVTRYKNKVNILPTMLKHFLFIYRKKVVHKLPHIRLLYICINRISSVERQ